ncbi:MAG: DegT/DnrJ/EryC1/StrS family aminotransferase [Verrucomicrobiae bacterium]|nr:DegT/DnrJ/EryC1/StrS family aminotransferase [Verrucomicrobiae bacterium]
MNFSSRASQPLALFGGPKCVESESKDLFHWPIVTVEDEQAVLEVLRAGTMSGTGITKQFEAEFAKWMGVNYALASCNGTASLHEAMWACGVGAGDEVICPSMTYWASCAAALTLGATVNFCDIERDSLCLDPRDFERRISPKTKAVIVVHYAGYPADMDAILPIARRHGVKVIEDVSHAQGSLYKGRMCGTMGDIAGISLMAGKSFAIGEGGMMLTNDKTLFERCVAFGHYERTGVSTRWTDKTKTLDDPELARYAGLPMFGVKHRINQTCSAMGRVQLRHYPARIAVIQKALNRFWDLLEGTPGLRAHRPPKDSGSTMGGWYFARGLYRAEELGGLPIAAFCEAVRAEGVGVCSPGCNTPLHNHPLFHTADIFGMGRPTALSFGQRDVRQGTGALPVSETISEAVIGVPWFKHDRPEIIERYAAAYRKVALRAGELRKKSAEDKKQTLAA